MSANGAATFEPYLERWALTADGAEIVTHTSKLLPVRTRAGDAAIVKLALTPEERAGAALMAWWGGEGAARVLAHDDPALLMERATGSRSLVAMAARDDDEATRLLCAAAAKLHAPRPAPPPATLVPLERWFAALAPAARKHGGILMQSLATARELLASPQDLRVLHGDIHHANVLDAGARGWLAIDPKGLLGERGYDFANLFRNPTLEIAAAPGRLARRADIVAHAAGLDRARLLRWVLAYTGLSAAWTLDDGGDASIALAIAHIAAAELQAR